MEGKEGGMEIGTFFMFSARRSYSSRTSCSRGVRSSFVALLGSVLVGSEESIVEVDMNEELSLREVWPE